LTTYYEEAEIVVEGGEDSSRWLRLYRKQILAADRRWWKWFEQLLEAAPKPK
jgi:hypothetical protein